MLTYLGVRGFAIIDELKIEFGEGFNVITGETGAGKSIVINALATLMNAKSAPDAVRTDAAQAEVTGHFVSGNEEYILKRIIGNSGRSRAFLNDEPITLAKMEGLGSTLISVYGQNEFQHLLDKENYPVIIDKLLGLDEDRQKLAEKVDELKRVSSDLAAVKWQAEGKDREIALIEFQINEIDAKNIGDTEEETLRERLKVLKSAERIGRVFDEISESLQGSDNSVNSMLKSCVGTLRGLGNIEAIEDFKMKMDTLSYEIEDLISEMHAFQKTTLFDEEEMLKIEDRLSEIFKLQDKYGRSLDEIRSFRDNAQKRLEYLKGITDNIDSLERLRADLSNTVEQMSMQLSLKRKKGSPRIEKIIVEELGFLSMNSLQFRISIDDKGHIERDGRDNMELLISTNPGEPLKPLRKIASGGELSRIMLAIKKVIGGEEEKSLIFDEVDAGIGGRIADMVGKRLKDLSTKHQILCITHLPQIAAYGDRHFVVEKQVISGRTRTAIRQLAPEERVEELARMLGGMKITDITIKRAREMLQI
ncbi:MAG: recN [Deltaproteobacteria bacterium]|nr:recN [Deltaproteobacteria bacterium]